MKNSIKTMASLFLMVILLTACGKDSDNDVQQSCPKVTNLSFSANVTTIEVYFSLSAMANSFKIEYGPTGFALGNGTVATTSSSQYTISGLASSTTYDIYVTSICSSTDQSAPASLLSVTTAQSQCQGTPTLTVSEYSTDAVILNYNLNGVNVYRYEIEYGLAGFELGTGTRLEESSNSLVIHSILPNTAYDFYVRSVCFNDDYSSYRMVTYTSNGGICQQPTNLNATPVGGSCNNSTRTFSFSWSSSSSSASTYTISIISTGGDPNNGTLFTTNDTSIQLTNFSCSSRQFYVKANCSTGNSSPWAGPSSF